MTITTNYNTDLGSIFVSYADVQNLFTSSIVTLIGPSFGSGSGETSTINYYNTQTNSNTYSFPASSSFLLIISSGYYVNVTINSATTSLTYYTGNYVIPNTSSSTGTFTINYITLFSPIGQFWFQIPNSSKTLTNIVGNNVNSNNIVLGVSNGSTNSVASPAISYSGNIIYQNYNEFYYTTNTNLSHSSTTNINNISMSSLILGSTPIFVNGNEYGETNYYLNAIITTQLSPQSSISISNDNSLIIVILVATSNAYLGMITYPTLAKTGSVIGIFYFNSSFTLIDVYFISNTTQTAIQPPIYSSKFETISSLVIDSNSSWNLSAVQVSNGITYVMIAGTSGLITGTIISGTTTYTLIYSSTSFVSISMSSTGEFQLACPSSGGIYYSYDFGSTFHNVMSTYTFSLVFLSSSSNYAIAYCTSDSYLYKSLDYGQTWNKTTTTTYSGITSISMTYNGKNIVITGSSGSYYSNDYGSTFNTSNTNFNSSNNVILSSFSFPSITPIGLACGASGIYTSQ